METWLKVNPTKIRCCDHNCDDDRVCSEKTLLNRGLRSNKMESAFYIKYSNFQNIHKDDYFLSTKVVLKHGEIDIQ